jgi:hypothetical protein
MEKKNTIFCDIDGTIFKYRKFETYTTSEVEPIMSTVLYLKEQSAAGNMIILTTARPEPLFWHTKAELLKHDIPYNKLIMGIERGVRILINDMDPADNIERAVSINLQRDKGIVL